MLNIAVVGLMLAESEFMVPELKTCPVISQPSIVILLDPEMRNRLAGKNVADAGTVITVPWEHRILMFCTLLITT